MQKVSLYEIGQRANILHKTTEENEVIIYEDHRTILNVLYFIIKKRGIEGPLDIIMFDNHDDFCDINPDLLKKLPAFLEKFDERKLSTLVEFDLKGLDDDWVKMGMELNLIGNCFLFNSKESRIRDKEEYKTQLYGTKYFFNLGDVWSTLYNKGALNDIIGDRHKDLRDAFGWKYEQGHFSFKQERRNFILDFDLDCFSTVVLDETIAIPEKMLVERFTKPHLGQNHYYCTAQMFVKELILKSEAVTICSESDYCGGIRESQKIFNLVDYLFFENQLGEK